MMGQVFYRLIAGPDVLSQLHLFMGRVSEPVDTSAPFRTVFQLRIYLTC